MMSDPSSSDTSATQRTSRARVRERLQESRSRLLSLLGLRTAISAPKCDPPQSAPVLTAEVEACSDPSCISPAITTGDSETAPASPDQDSDHATSFSFAITQPPQEDQAQGQPNPHALQKPGNNDDCSRVEKQGRRSSPAGFTELVANKLSMTFGNPTVIHRSHLRSRPSVRDVPFEKHPSISLAKQGDSANDSSDPSTPNSCRDSPATPLSTPPTSESPPILRGTLSNVQEDHVGCLSLSRQGTTKCVCLPDQITASPSILTVEAAANAKVFFETYFKTVYSDTNPRAQRQRELEQYMYALPIRPEEKARVWNNWRNQEREYLRQCRVLKTPSFLGQQAKSVSMAGFEVIKILGKGSFGVVRLVREIGECEETGEPVTKGRSFSFVRTEVVGDKNESKQYRRRIMTGVKKDVFAMKVIRKSIMIRNCQEGHLRAERDLLVASAKSRWIVPLIASFQDAHSLYLIMDYMVGGDFLGLLLRRCVLTENIARWYVAEMILCIEEAHRLCCIHRDVKPDNFLISASGHLKISDFGLAFDGHWAHDQLYYSDHRYSLIKKLGIQVDGDKHDQIEARKAENGSRDSGADGDLIHMPTIPSAGVLGWRDRHQMRRWARSIVGTSQYMAPEVVRGELYDGRCDWWSVGVILYECLYGYTPFSSKDRQETKWKIHHHLHTLQFPVRKPSDKLISAEAIDLISHLLQEKDRRLSCGKYHLNDTFNPRLGSGHLFGNTDAGAASSKGFYVYPDDAVDIKAHPFFRGIIWDEHHRSNPPFIPKVRGWEDTRYFDEAGPYDGNDMPMTSESDASDSETAAENPPAPKRDPPQPENENQGVKADEAVHLKIKKKNLLKREKKRPRDKILRDKKLGKTVLEMRKKGAFAGYTYRRPKTVVMAFSPEQVRPYRNRGQLSELYGC